MSEIDPQYLTCAEYQLFLDDARRLGKYHQPDHWPGLRFAPGESLRPVKGVRAEDAVAFCEWLTGREGARALYRLPRPEEALSCPADAPDVAAWCDGGDGFRLVGLDEAFKEKIRAQVNDPRPLSLSRFDFNYSFDTGLVRRLGIDLSPVVRAARILAETLIEITNFARELRALDFERDLGRVYARATGISRRLKNVGEAVEVRDVPNLRDAFAAAADLASNLEHLFRDSRMVEMSPRHYREWNAIPEDERNFKATVAGAVRLALSLARVIAPARFAAASVRDLRAVRRFALRSLKTLDAAPGLWDMRLCELSNANDAEVLRRWRRIQRLYLAERLWRVRRYMALSEEYRPSYWPDGVSWLLENVRADDVKSVRPEDVMELYWGLQILIEREAGTLPAWEGIRIVREQA